MSQDHIPWYKVLWWMLKELGFAVYFMVYMICFFIYMMCKYDVEYHSGNKDK